jgi:SAM-dependent methyltransferase
MSYLMANQPSELERLQVQSRVWEPAGERLLAQLGDGQGRRALDVGCGALGWLRVLARWVGASGEVVGTDLDETLLAAAQASCTQEGFASVHLVRDDYFATSLPTGSFDLVHLRFQICPLGRAQEQVAIAHTLVKPGGWVVLEDPDAGSWREHPVAPAAEHLRELIVEAFARAGGDFNAGRRLPEYLRAAGIAPSIQVACVALEPGHPYLQLPLQFATSLRPRLLALAPEGELDRLMETARTELADLARWGTPFTLVQAWGKAM